ncbi:MAG: GNAT family N-acetyltransferase [Bacillota bacterium]|nr:GNAT family N-acetyltransferase [Bacillota bacterium]
MENLSLIEPDCSLKNQYLEMLEDWKLNDAFHIPWYISMETNNFKVSVEKLKGFSKGIGIEERFVESSTYWLVNDDKKILGALNIRHRLNEFYINYGGQIGYGIRPSERRKGYAKKALGMGLDICRNMGFKEVLLCCNSENSGSINTILANGGVLDSESEFSGEKIQRYWIDLH